MIDLCGSVHRLPQRSRIGKAAANNTDALLRKVIQSGFGPGKHRDRLTLQHQHLRQAPSQEPAGAGYKSRHPLVLA